MFVLTEWDVSAGRQVLLPEGQGRRKAGQQQHTAQRLSRHRAGVEREEELAVKPPTV